MTEIAKGIDVDPQIRFGKPVIHGTRVPVETVVARIASGMTFEQVAEEYGIRLEDVRNAMQYAARLVAEETLLVSA
jgi:uncharacterized protein (DUF433 family)